MNAFAKIRVRGVVSCFAGLLAAGAAWAGPGNPLPVGLDPANVRVMTVRVGGGPGGGITDECLEYASHTSHQFLNQPPATPVIMQGGFAEQEIAAASYTLPVSSFPVRIRSMEMLFATMASIPTTTEWSVVVWRGFPNTGAVVAEFSSDGGILPHLEMPAAFGGQAQATVIQLLIDPTDPEQIIIENAGTATFSVGFRIDNHNNQTGNPCVAGGVPIGSNAFPCTFNDGQQNPQGNWLRAVNCGPFGCPPGGGWVSFAAMQAACGFVITGDWVLRAQWEPSSCGGCYADCNSDTQLTVADFGCFQTRFVGGEAYADCNADSQLSVADFGCFQTKFVVGCPP